MGNSLDEYESMSGSFPYVESQRKKLESQGYICKTEYLWKNWYVLKFWLNDSTPQRESND